MRRIAQETINRVLEEVDIFEVISQYVDLKKRGKNYFGLSPFRSETKPSFSVAPDKNMWYDFGSGQGGNAVGFLIEYEKISFSEPDILDKIFNRLSGSSTIPILGSIVQNG